MKLFITAAITCIVMVSIGYFTEGKDFFVKFPSWFALVATSLFLFVRAIVYKEFKGFGKKWNYYLQKTLVYPLSFFISKYNYL